MQSANVLRESRPRMNKNAILIGQQYLQQYYSTSSSSKHITITLMKILFFCLFLFCAQSQGTYNHDSVSYRNQTWMGSLDDGIPIRQISIIGTHNSIGLKHCLLLGLFQQTQSNSLSVQLLSGIRALDIRIKHKNDQFLVYDRICQLGDFDEVLSVVQSFLGSNPSESILIHVVEERSSSGVSRSIGETFKSYCKNYTDLFWMPTTQDPTLGQVRGKAVLLQEFASPEIHGLLYATFSVLPHKFFLNNWNLYDKWVDVKTFLAESNSAGKSKINFWTGHGLSYPYFVASGHLTPSTKSPRLSTGMITPLFKKKYPDFPRVVCFFGICTIVFEGINILGFDYIKSQNLEYFGILYTDFYGQDLIQNAISVNSAKYPKCSSTLVNQGCLQCSATNQCAKCNTVLNYKYEASSKSCISAVGYYLNSGQIPKKCSDAIIGCLQCDSEVLCNVCDTFNKYLLQSSLCVAAPGYYLDSDSIPIVCPQTGCSECKDEGECEICSQQINYAFDSATYKCFCDAASNFVQAPSAEICICTSDYFLLNSNICEDMPKCPGALGGCLDCDTSDVCQSCDSTNNFILDPTNQFCICKSSFFFDESTCQPCSKYDAACLSCANELICLQCEDNFTSKLGVCKCLEQHYSVDNNTCNKCSTGCLECTGLAACTKCDQASNFKLTIDGSCTCIINMFEENETCHPCGSMAGCVDCTTDGCIACDPIFGFSLQNSLCNCDYGFFVNQMNICQKCAMEGCLHCNNQLQCLECNSTEYYLNDSSICDDICGDGSLIYDICDDGNLANSDGCSDQCVVQEHYTCIGGSKSSKSDCSYSGPITLTLHKSIKDEKKNKVYIKASIAPKIMSMASIDFSSVMIPTFPIKQKFVNFDFEKGVVQFNFTYNQSLNSKTSDELKISFIPPTDDPSYFFMKDSSFNLPSVSSNNLALKYYDEDVYDQLDTMDTLVEVLTYLFLTLFVFCFIMVSKLMALEMLLIPQVIFAALVTIQKLESLLLPFGKLYISNGYSQIVEDNVEIPPRMDLLLYKGQLLSNFNICLALILIPVFVGLGFLALGHFKNQKFLKRTASKILKQWTLSAFLVFQFQYMIAIGIDIQYCQSPIGLIIGAVLVLSQIAFMVQLYRNPLNFGDFKQFFKKQPIHLNHYMLVIPFRVIVISVIIFAANLPYCGFIISSFFVLYCISIIVFKPFKSNIRPAFNSAIISAICLIEAVYKLDQNSSESSSLTTTYLPYFILSLLFVAFVANFVFILLKAKELIVKKQAEKYSDFNADKVDSVDEDMKKELDKHQQVISKIHSALLPNEMQKNLKMKDESGQQIMNFRSIRNAIRQENILIQSLENQFRIYDQI